MGRRPAHTVQVSGGYLNGAGRLLETTIARPLTYATHLQNNVLKSLQEPPKQQVDELNIFAASGAFWATITFGLTENDIAISCSPKPQDFVRTTTESIY